MQITSAAILISVSLVIFGIAYYFFTTRHKERMAILERSLPPDHFKDQSNWPLFLLTLGIISIGIALGTLTGALVTPLVGLPEIVVITTCIFLFLGFSLLISYKLLTYSQRKKTGR